MGKQKTHKATAKRFTITKTKKVLKRHGGQNHFNARVSGNKTRLKRKDSELSPSFKKTVLMLSNNLS